MSKRILITLNDEQQETLAKLMKEDVQSNRAGYIVNLIGAEARRRVKKPAGRPKSSEEVEEVEEEKDYTNDLPKNIPHFGRMIGKQELADIEERHESIKPFTQPQG